MAPLRRYILLWLSVTTVCSFATEGESNVELDLVFTDEPQDVIVLRGEPFVFNCSAISVTDNNRPVNITWRRDGDLVNDARRYVLPNGSLYFERTVRKKHGRGDEGFYECLARQNGEAIVSRSARLTIAAIERVEGMKTVAAVEGEMVRLPCNLKAVPQGTITWQKDKTDLLPDSRYTILDSGVLQIEGVLEADTGQYRCRISNIAGTKFSWEDEIIIQRPEGPPGRKPPEMLLLPQYPTKKVGETVTLECAASGLPMPTFTWTFLNGTAVRGPRVKLVGRSNLQITNLEMRDAEMYKCIASNPDNPAQQSEVITRLIVIEPPTIVESSPSMEGQLSDTVRIRCAFRGTPTPKVTVFKDGIYEGPIASDKPEHIWIIHYLDKAHKGYYQCRAENDAGQVSTTMRLKIKPSDLTPDKPRNVRARVTGPTSLYVEWDPVPPKNGVEVWGYSVHYSNVADQLELQAVTLETNWKLNQLTPFSNVSIYVLAYNSQNASPRSDLIYQLIGEDVPIAGPTVTAQPIGASSLKVTWEKLPIEKARGIITEYDVYYREHDKGSIKVETVQGDVYEYTLSGLDPNKAYDVRVMGKTKLGFPQLSDDEWPWVTAYTNSQHSALEPPNMQVYALNQTAVQVRWHPTSPDHGGVAGYRLQVLTTGNAILKQFLPTPEQHHYTFTGLEADTLYKISLRCLGGLGQDIQEGEPTVRNVKTLKVGEPGVLPTSPPPPQQLDAFPVNRTAVRLQWYRPKYTPGISFYTLRFKPVQSDLTKASPNSTFIKHVVTNDNETLERLISGLKAYTLYEFTVRTHTTYSFGTFSYAVRCRTDEGFPSAPHNVHSTLVGQGRVKLTWEPPRQRNGVISKYVIYYKPDNTDQAWANQVENGTTLMAEVDNLPIGLDVVFKLVAKTSVGKGPASREVRVRIQNPYAPGGLPKSRKGLQEQRKGIIIGVTLTGIVIVICIVLIILRNRCCRQAPAAAAATRLGSGASPNSTLPLHFNGTYMPNSNGNRYLCNSSGMMVDAHTMETLTPMLPPLVENENSDSKGGSGVNGMPGLRVQCMPNGQVATFLTNQDSHIDKQKTSCLMGNGRSGITVAATVPEGRPDITRDDPALGSVGSASLENEDEEEDDEECSAPSSLSQASTSRVTSASPPDPPCRSDSVGSVPSTTEKDCVNTEAPEVQHPAHNPHKSAQNSSSQLDCEEGDGETDAVAEETESSRLLSHHHPKQPSPPQPTQSLNHPSSLTEYASSPPQSRYQDSDGNTELSPSDGDTSGTPLLCGSPSDEPLQFSPTGSHSHTPSDLPHA